MGTKTVTNLTAVLQMNNTKFKKGISGSKKAMTGMQKQMVAMKGLIATTFAIGAITSFTKSAFKALDTQRKAEAALLTALKGRSDVQRELIQQAQELQKLTLFGDEETIMAQSMIAAFVRSGETLKMVTPLVQDMATALGMDLVGAASLVAKTLGSSTNALTRYGITVTGAVGSSERLTSLVNGLSEAFEGQSIAAADADTSLTQLKNRWGDFQESVAGIIVSIGPAIKDFFNLMGQEEITKWDKFLSLFDSQRMAGLQAYAEAIDDAAVATEKAAKAAEKFQAIDFSKSSVGNFKKSGLWAMAFAVGDLPKAESAGTAGAGPFGGFEGQLPNINEGLATTLDLSNMLGDSWEEWASIMAEDVQNDFFPTINKMQTETQKLGEMVGVMMVSQFDALGDAIGRSLMGAEGALQSLGETILANLGNILIMVGLQMGPAGLPLIIAGAGLQLGSGLIKGLGATTPEAVRGNPNAGGSVNFKISGRDLTGVLQRDSTYRNQVT